VPFAIVKANELGGSVAQASVGVTTGRYTEAEAARTEVLVSAGHRLIETLFGADLPVK
jgi:hypothetical protein